jgi:hypothetical protein
MSFHESASAMPSLRPGAYAPIMKQVILDPTKSCELCDNAARSKRVLVDVCGTSCELDVCTRCAKAAV